MKVTVVRPATFWNLKTVTDYERIQRKQALLEAEGYLELSMGLSDRWPLAPHLRVGLAQRALDTLDRVAEWGARQPHVLYLTGQAYRVMHRYREALPPLEEASELDSENTLIWLALAWCYKRIGRLDRAIQALENGLVADPREAILYYNLACYWSLAGNAQRAIQHLAQSFELDSAYRDLVADEPDFDPLRDLPDFQALTSVIV